MKKIFVSLAVCLAIASFAVSAMAWGSATHAYTDERINNKGPLLKLNQVYTELVACNRCIGRNHSALLPFR